jgi:peroxiredoxin
MVKSSVILVLAMSFVLGLAGAQEDHHHHGAVEAVAVTRELPGVQGNLGELDLEAYRGKVVVIAAVAGWCVGCFPKVPNFVKLQEDYAERGVVVIGVMTQSAPEWTETFVERFKVSYPVYLDMSGRAAVERFGTQIVPTGMVVYDREGNLVELMSGFEADKLRPILERLL